MKRSKGFVGAVMVAASLAAACASSRTTKSAGEQLDDSVKSVDNEIDVKK